MRIVRWRKEEWSSSVTHKFKGMMLQKGIQCIGTLCISGILQFRCVSEKEDAQLRCHSQNSEVRKKESADFSANH